MYRAIKQQALFDAAIHYHRHYVIKLRIEPNNFGIENIIINTNSVIFISKQLSKFASTKQKKALASFISIGAACGRHLRPTIWSNLNLFSNVIAPPKMILLAANMPNTK